MKKLLLVLMVVAMAAFLLVGCLPGTTPGEGEGEGEGEVEVTMTFDKEYTDASGVTFVPCGDTVTVTLPTPVAVDYVVYLAVKWWDEGDQEYEYYYDESGVPNADRTVWTFENYTYAYPCEDFKKETNGIEICECEPICIVALVKHPRMCRTRSL